MEDKDEVMKMIDTMSNSLREYGEEVDLNKLRKACGVMLSTIHRMMIAEAPDQTARFEAVECSTNTIHNLVYALQRDMQEFPVEGVEIKTYSGANDERGTEEQH